MIRCFEISRGRCSRATHKWKEIAQTCAQSKVWVVKEFSPFS